MKYLKLFESVKLYKLISEEETNNYMTDNKPDDKEMDPSIKIVKKYFKDNNISINIKPKSDTFSSRWYRHSFAVGVESDYCVLKMDNFNASIDNSRSKTYLKYLNIQFVTDDYILVYAIVFYNGNSYGYYFLCDSRQGLEQFLKDNVQNIFKRIHEAFTDKDEYYRKLTQDEYNVFMHHSEDTPVNLKFTQEEISKIMRLFPEETNHKYHTYDKGRDLYKIEKGFFDNELQFYIIAPYFQKGNKLCRIQLVKKKDNWYYVHKVINRIDNIHKAEWKHTWYECDNIDGLRMLLKDIKRGSEQKSKTN